MARTKDKTVYKSMGFNSFGLGSNGAAVDVKDGRIVRIRPMHLDEKYSVDEIKPWTIESHGKKLESGLETTIAPFAMAYKKRVYSKNRVPFPMKRVDWDPSGERHPETRGISGYERISWDEACQIIADEIKRFIDVYGMSSIYLQADGHGEAKTIGGTHGANSRLLDFMGGGYTLQARQPDSWEGWYWGAKHMWGMDPVGQQAFQNGLVKDIADNSQAALFVGCDPETTPWGWGGMMASKISYFWTECGVKQIYICPDLNYGAAIHADKWIPVLPNTDAALWLGVAYTWLKEGTYDKEYLSTHAEGFDWFERYVMGGEDGVAKTPKWAEGKCGVPSRQIKALARYWAKNNVSTVHGNGGGYIRSAFATEPARLEIALLAMQGLGAPGRNMFKMLEWGMFGMPQLNPLPQPAWGGTVQAAYTGHMAGSALVNFIPQTLLPKAIMMPEGEKLSWSGHVVCTYPRTDQYQNYEYPNDGASRIHMIWTDTPCWSTCWNGGNLLQDALRTDEIEFVLVQHPWLENDTYFADIILPTTTKLEEKDIMTTSMCGENNLVLDEAQAVEPIGEAKSDAEAVLCIADKLGLRDQLMENWCYPPYRIFAGDGHKVECSTEHVHGEPSFDTLMKIGFYQGGLAEHMEWGELKEKGYLPIPFAPVNEGEPVGMQLFYENPDTYALDTPTGKIEFYSTAIAEVWGDDGERPPVPHWIEESPEHHERLTNERGKDFPFLMVSNHPRWRVHAQHDDIPWTREIETCKVKGPDGYLYEPVWINPIDARERGIEDGDIVRIYNERGSVLGGAYVTERIRTHTVSQDHGARVDCIVGGTGGLDRGGANNLICPNATTSKNAPGEVTNGFLVNIEKVDVLELAKKHPNQFNREYDPSCGMIASARIAKEA